VTPGAKFTLILMGKDRVALSAESVKELTLKPGETKNLGDIRVQAAPAQKKSRDKE
jgi:hypothetical protein